MQEIEDIKMKQADYREQNKGRYLLAALSLLVSTNIHAVDNQIISINDVDTSKWKCKLCLFEENKGFSGEVEFGLGNVSDESFKFGEYSGLNEKGGFVLLSAQTRYRGDNASYLDFSVTNLGLDTRSLDIEGGVQGKYSLFLNYDEIAHFISNSANSPFTGVGTGNLTLPGWIPAGTTSSMSSLAGSLRPVELKTQRRQLAVGASIVQGLNWEYDMKVRRETKDGKLGTAGTFFFSSAELIMPVDYITDQIDVSTSYTGKEWQAKLAYYGSTFRNNNKALIWQNPYTPLVAGADSGQISAPPDNEFHQIILSAGHRFSKSTRIMGKIAVGRMQQDEAFLASTLNAGIGAPALPQTSLNGQVDTLNANLKIHSSVTDKLRLNATLRHDERDNKTPQAVFDWVTTDAFLATARTNLPYSFQKESADISAVYRYSKSIKLSAGLDHDITKRTYQEARRTEENTFWGKVKLRTKDRSDISFKYNRTDHNAREYTAVPEIDGPENPLMRKYNMADRIGDRYELKGSMMLTEKTQISAGINYGHDEYLFSALGLTDSSTLALNADLSYVINDNTSLYAFLNHEQIESQIAGSNTFSVPDWIGKNNDFINTAGIGIKNTAMNNKLDTGIDLVLTRSTGEVVVSNSTPFPDLRTELDSLKLYADYKMKDHMTLSAAIWHERYATDDWTLDGVTETTISNVLSLGETSPDYNVNAITVSMRYKF